MQPSMRKPCPECGGQRVIVDILPVQLIYKEGSSPFGKKGKSNSSEIYTFACVQCGYISCYATTPANIIPDE